MKKLFESVPKERVIEVLNEDDLTAHHPEEIHSIRERLAELLLKEFTILEK